jgi:hypothetical protein
MLSLWNVNFLKMEFFYDHKTGEWTNVTNEEKRFAVHLYGVTVPMDDFYEAWATFRKKHPNDKIGDIDLDNPEFLFQGYVPIVGNSFAFYYYEIQDNEWKQAFGLNDHNFVRNHHMLFNYIAESLHNRVEKLEGLFDTIRQRSSIIDEFIKIGEQVLKQ